MTMRDLTQQLAEIRRFTEERFNPLEQTVNLNREEMGRLRQEVEGILAAQQEYRRAQLLAPSNDRPRVRGGRYDGLSALDLAFLGSMARGFMDRPGNTDRQLIEGWRQASERITGARRALDSTTAGAGDELVPTLEASELWNDVNLQTAIASLISTINMPSNPFDIPLQLGDINWYPGTANIASKSTDPATAKRTLTAYELVGMVAWAYELDEDAVLAMLPELRRTLVRNAAEVMDDILLNADTTLTNNINADGATIGATDVGKGHWLIGFDGLRHIPLVDNTGQGTDVNAALTAALFNANRKAMGKYGVRPSEVVHVVDINTYIKALTLTEVQSLDKFGPQATILTGQLAALEGVPIIVSEQLRLADTDGKVTDAGNGVDTGSILTFNRSQYRKGFKRELMIETERDIQKRQTVMVASMRVGFDGRNANSSDEAVALQYDITGVA